MRTDEDQTKDLDANSTEGMPSASTGGRSEAGQAAVAAVLKVEEKRTKKGNIYGVKPSSTGERRPTASQMAFVQGLLQGKSKIQAYKDAYNVRTQSDSTISVSASKLMKSPTVIKLLSSFEEQFKDKIIEDAVRTRRWVMERLHEKAVTAKTESTELKALELMGKAVGMFTDKVEQTVEQVDAGKLKEELRSHLRLLEKVPPTSKRSA